VLRVEAEAKAFFFSFLEIILSTSISILLRRAIYLTFETSVLKS